MHLEYSMANYLLTAIAAGLCGLAALELAMWLITRRGWAQGNMIIAVGSLLTRSRENAFRVGTIVHCGAGILFALLYTIALRQVGWDQLPAALTAGLAFGTLHGMIVSLMLVWVVAEHHPLEEFNEAGLAIGVSHLAGHVAYGGAVGLVVGLMSQ